MPPAPSSLEAAAAVAASMVWRWSCRPFMPGLILAAAQERRRQPTGGQQDPGTSVSNTCHDAAATLACLFALAMLLLMCRACWARGRSCTPAPLGPLESNIRATCSARQMRRGAAPKPRGALLEAAPWLLPLSFIRDKNYHHHHQPLHTPGLGTRPAPRPPLPPQGRLPPSRLSPTRTSSSKSYTVTGRLSRMKLTR